MYFNLKNPHRADFLMNIVLNFKKILQKNKIGELTIQIFKYKKKILIKISSETNKIK